MPTGQKRPEVGGRYTTRPAELLSVSGTKVMGRE